ncbi:MAG: acyl carrier protein [Clostridia bacterium]|nr:acyl carrier protein [Clostridia bacterium]
MDKSKLYDILRSLHADVDFEKEKGLVDNGILDSLDIVTLITEINDAYDVELPAEEILPENFNSADALWALIQRLEEE